MARFFNILAGFLVVLALTASARADGPNLTFPAKTIGEERAPIVIDEYISLTCPHCADFYLNTLPELEKRYVKTGKVKIIMHDYPLDGLALKAAALARCMPPSEYFPFIQILYDNQPKWIGAGNPDKVLVQYARLGGLDEDRARTCLNDQNIQNAIVAERAQANDQYNVDSTPTFVFNKGVEKMAGAADINGFAATIDRMLSHSKK